VSDGAAAIVITTTENAKKMEKEAVEIASLVHVTDYLELDKRPQYVFEGSKIAVDQAYEQANITVDDLDFAEVHDCFTIAELLAYNAIGLVENGKEREVLLDGTVTKEGKLPVNISGGLKAKGHPVGTTGVSMAVLATRQLLGNAIGIQLDNPKTGLTLNFGGSAVSSYATVFRKL
jgi:acetyl-CoA C-acetyltransferase